MFITETEQRKSSMGTQMFFMYQHTSTETNASIRTLEQFQSVFFHFHYHLLTLTRYVPISLQKSLTYSPFSTSSRCISPYSIYPSISVSLSIGSGEAAGRNINIPLPCPNCGDDEFLSIFNSLILPAAAEFAPSVVLVSAGFDIMEGDAVGRMLVTPRGIHQLTRLLIEGIPSAKVGCIPPFLFFYSTFPLFFFEGSARLCA